MCLRYPGRRRLIPRGRENGSRVGVWTRASRTRFETPNGPQSRLLGTRVRHTLHCPGAGCEHVVYYLLVHRRGCVHEAARREVDSFVEGREMESGRHGAIQFEVRVLA